MPDSNFSYSSLTPELQLDALASVGIYPETGLMQLNSYENRVSLFTDENKIRYVVKFYRPQRWNEAQILEDHAFSLQLKEQGCLLAEPVLLEEKTLFEFQGYYFALFKSLSARSLESDNLDHLYEVGVTLGKLHKISSQGTFQTRERLDIKTMLSTPIKQLKESKLVPKFISEELFLTMDKVEKITTELFNKSNFTAIRLHGDCHASNILMDRDTPYLVDFDDCKIGPAVQDLWMLLSENKEEKKLQLSTLLEGYEEEFEFDSGQLALIEPLRSMRIIHYVSWINKRWSDPAFPLNFPWFTTDQYWLELLQSLQQQIINMQAPPVSMQPDY
ncbi:serine/threonine protein kinase [Psychromonas sp. Urea-02u-13]|uniref:serine/threonine protein kinase n=1 Tax=Psychromonas sp. Urea-02u-13 TaxID=2058326 RepID=UPI000C32F3E4|nr:serine/threonine protein kinase [Psychromonas sp. Urea-02u-13]PKG39201.1 serine/threonine protein kinase [Psychromonas sp. Urea-02u-13]